VEPREHRFSHWIGLDTFGIITIEQGDINEVELIPHLRRLFDETWDWKLRSEEEYTYITRFPPHKRVENLVIGKATLFELEGTNVVASLKPWNGDVEPISRLKEVWVQVKGIPPKWVDWWTIKDIALSLGLLLEVDWTELFKVFFSMARIRIKCKNPARIPFERIYELGGSCFLIHFKTEGVMQLGEPKDGGDDHDGDGNDGDSHEDKNRKDGKDNDEEDLEDDDLLDDELREQEGQDKEKGTKNGDKRSVNQTGEKSNQGKSGQTSTSQGESRSVRRSLEFFGVNQEHSLEQYGCVYLLKAMEIDGTEVEEIEDITDKGEDVQLEEGQLNLPLEWIDHLTNLREGNGLVFHSDNMPTGEVKEIGDAIGSQPTTEDL